MEALGLEVIEQSGTRVSGWLEAGPQHHQPFGLVHGGVYTAVAETVASIGGHLAVMEGGRTAVGVNNNVDFLRSHRTGRLEVVAEPLLQGRSQQLWQVVISRAEDGEVVARGQVRLANVGG